MRLWHIVPFVSKKSDDDSACVSTPSGVYGHGSDSVPVHGDVSIRSPLVQSAAM